jgi:hypothetical protein
MKTLLTLLFLPIVLFGQKLTTNPERFTASEKVKITIDLSAMPNFSSEDKMYLWAWTDVTPNKVNNGDWKNSNETALLQKEGKGIFSFNMTPAEFYGINAADLKKIQFLIKTKDGNKQSADITLFIGKTVAESKQILTPKPIAEKPTDFRNIAVKSIKMQAADLAFKLMKVQVGKAAITINPKIELAYTIGVIGGYPSINPNTMAYKTEIFRNFESFKNDPFVKEFTEKIFGKYIDGAANFMLNLDDNFEPMPSMPSFLIEGLGGANELQNFVNRLKQFCVKIKYATFFNSQKPFFDLAIANYAFTFKDYKDIDLIENYYSFKQNSYSIVLNPLFGMGYFGVICKNYSGVSDIYIVLQPESVTNGLPVYESGIGQYSLMFHEFSHSFVNPLVEQYIDQVAVYSDLYEPISDKMKPQGYQEWIVTVKEHIVRAVTCRLGALKYGETIGKTNFQNFENDNYFIYVDALIEKLKFYEQNRNKYKDFKTFFPELIAVFKNVKPVDIENSYKAIAEKKAQKQVAKIPKVYEVAFNEKCVLVVATHEASDQKTVTETVEKFHNMANKQYKILTDDEALKTNLSDSNVLLFGTLEGNSYLQKHFSKIPITVTKNKIMTDIEMIGTNFQFVFSWLNPDNENKAMVVFGAQQASDVKDYFYSPFKDGYNFWIAKNLVTVHAGNFKNMSGQWLPSK